jgi:DNA adenine methylase
MSSSKVPHPIPYQGSKRTLAARIISHIPGDSKRLIEPFAGSAAVSLAAAYYGRSREFLIADANEALVDLWREIIHRPTIISDAYTALWQAQLGQERSFYDIVRAKFNQTHQPDHFLYLLARCVKGSVRYNPQGEFNQSPDNRRKGTRPATMRARILRASQLLKGKTELMCADYRNTLSHTESSDIVYMDPPYRGVCVGRDKRYMGTLSFDEAAFVGVLGKLADSSIRFIVSYDGRTGEKTYGKPLPDSLGLTRLELNAGRSSQATLLGRDAHTVESLYISSYLMSSACQHAFPILN